MPYPLVSIIISAYNEEASLSGVISAIKESMNRALIPFEIIIVDDGSTDKTSIIASKSNSLLLLNKENRGKGYSLRKALKYVNSDIVVTLDADGEHDPKDIPSLLMPVFNGVDVVAGSRFLGNNCLFTSRLNMIGNFLINFVILAVTGRQITDSQTGFRALKLSAIEKMSLESDGFEIEAEITVKCLKQGILYEEKPIKCERRKHGVSNIKLLRDGRRIFEIKTGKDIRRRISVKASLLFAISYIMT